MVSHKVKNNQKMIRAFAIDRNKISTQIFLFSVLFILEKNTVKHIRAAINSQTKCRLKFLGLNIVSQPDHEEGKNVHDSRENVM